MSRLRISELIIFLKRWIFELAGSNKRLIQESLPLKRLSLYQAIQARNPLQRRYLLSRRGAKK